MLISVLFITLLVLSIALMFTLISFIKVKAYSPKDENERAQANAKVGLMIALGELNRVAAQDQASSAQFDIANPDPHYQRKKADDWIAVWDTSNPQKAPTLLVSGGHDSQQLFAQPEANTVTLLKTPRKTVEAPKQILGTAQETGHYAYWISDEGLKAPQAFNKEKPQPAIQLSIIDKTALPQKGGGPLPQSALKTVIPSKQDYVADNHFVRSNPLQGGLKKSFLKYIPKPEGEFKHFHENSLDFLNFKNPAPRGSPISLKPTSASNPLPFSIYPLVPEFWLQAALVHNQAQNTLHLIYTLQFELWNPYDFPISMNYAINDIAIQLKDLPAVTVTNTTSEERTTLPLQPIRWEYERFSPLAAGGVYAIKMPFPQHTEHGVESQLIGRLPGKATDSFTFEIEASEAVLEFKSSVHYPESPFLVISNLAMPSYSITPIQEENLANPQSSREEHLLNLKQNQTFAYYFRYRDREQAHPQWLNKVEPRQRAIDLAEDESQLYDYFASPQNIRVKQPFSSDDFFTAQEQATPPRRRIAPIFHTAANSSASLSSLRQVRTLELPPFSVGMPSAGELNSIFDRFDLLSAENTKLQANAFNINSTSVEAWRVVLHNALDLYSKSKDIFRKQINLRSEEEIKQDLTHPLFTTRDPKLSAEQIDDLAEAIVREIKAYYELKRHPFLSIKDLINSSALQKAIAQVPSINPGQTDGSLNYAPGTFTQATLLKALAPLIHTRSDTFTIRAYGDAVTESDASGSNKAYCEAIVQRLPKTIDNTSNRRPFQIVYFRWLKESEI